ncbi:unnamed protein product [Camellia sinensis]
MQNMKSLSSVGLALSLVCGFLLLALVAELYYLLWWKKRIVNREIEDDYSNPLREFFYMFCLKKNPSSSSLSSTTINPNVHDPQSLFHAHSNKALWPKPFGEEEEDDGVEETELMGPPRFLFTIKEETKEDLESEDGKSRGDNKSRKGSRTRSLSESEVIFTVETPFLTPIASPPYFTPPLTPIESSYDHHGFMPPFESSSGDAEVNVVRSSPPPKLKFLKDAEEKLYRRKLEEDEKGVHEIDGFDQDGDKAPSTSELLNDEEDESFITLFVSKNE